MGDELVTIISEQTGILFANMDEVLNSIQDSQLYDSSICDWQLGEQLYHMLHSMDQWFINPYRFREYGITRLKTEDSARLSKSELLDYYRYVKEKITGYVEKVEVSALGEKPPACPFTRLALVLGQFRHFMYHIGLVHGCLRVHNGGTNPGYLGLGPPVKALTE